MKIEYIRNMQFGYMRIAIAEPLSRIEEEMLSHNKIEGILPIRWQKENEKYLLRYDITGKQALDVVLENEPLEETLLRDLLAGICAVVKQLEKHLLLPEGILLRPETIFKDIKTGQLYFCYYPNETESIQIRFRKLMEYMLAKTNHRNQKAVELSYGIYEEALKEEFVLQDIQKRLEKMVPNIYEQEEAEDKYLEAESIISDELEESLIKQNDLKVKKKRIFAFKEWKEICKTWFCKKVQKYIKLEKYIKSDKKQEKIVFEPEEEPVKTGLPTILLGEWKEEIEGILKYEGKYHLPDLSIKKVPFIIGSAHTCDGIIEQQTISNQHARISKIDEVYFIEDLNSTNGTTVDGSALNYKTKISLEKNMLICFAKEPYRFL